MDFDFLPSATQQTNTQNSFDFSPSSLNFETQPLHSFDDISQPSDNFLNSFLAENSSPNPPSFSLDPTDFINPSHQSSLSSELNYPPPINSPSPLANFEAPVEEKKENSLKYFFSGPPPTSDLSNNNNDKNNSGIVFSAPSSSGSAYSSLSSDSFLAPSPLKFVLFYFLFYFSYFIRIFLFIFHCFDHLFIFFNDYLFDHYEY